MLTCLLSVIDEVLKFFERAFFIQSAVPSVPKGKKEQ